MKNKLCLFTLLLAASCGRSGQAAASAADTGKETVYLSDRGKQNKLLFDNLKAELKKEKFAIERSAQEGAFSFKNCQTGEKIILKNASSYYIKRQEAKPADYYPDFVLYVFELASEREAEEAMEKIEEARHAHKRDCSMIEVAETARNGHEIFYLSTRAEMFRTYIRDFAKKLEGHH